jgi:hypothetical protein
MRKWTLVFAFAFLPWLSYSQVWSAATPDRKMSCNPFCTAHSQRELRDVLVDLNWRGPIPHVNWENGMCALILAPDHIVRGHFLSFVNIQRLSETEWQLSWGWRKSVSQESGPGSSPGVHTAFGAPQMSTEDPEVLVIGLDHRIHTPPRSTSVVELRPE